MGQAARWEKVAREWNGRYYPPKGLEQAQKVLAARDGYLAIIGTAERYYRTPVAYVAIRFPQGGNRRRLSEAIARDPAVLKALGKKVFPHRLRKRLRVSRGLLWFDRPYFFPPDPEQLAGLADAFLAVLPRHVGRFDGRCEVCATVPVAEPVLLNQVPLTYEQFMWLASVNEAGPQLLNTPGYVCPGCATRAAASRPAYPVRAALAGAAVALVGGLAMAVLRTIFEDWIAEVRRRDFIIPLGVFMAFPVAWAVKRGMGKVNHLAKVLAPLLTLGGVFAGLVLYFAHLVRRRSGGYNLDAALQFFLGGAPLEPLTAIAAVVGIVSGVFLITLLTIVISHAALSLLED